MPFTRHTPYNHTVHITEYTHKAQLTQYAPQRAFRIIYFTLAAGSLHKYIIYPTNAIHDLIKTSQVGVNM